MMNNIDQEFIDSVRADDLDAVTRLLQLGANVNVNYGYALKLSAKKGHLNILLKLLECNADLHSNHCGALRWSAKKGHLNIVTALLERGADVNAGAGAVFTALEFAARHNHLDVVIALLEAGADAHVDDDCTLRYACNRKHWRIVEKLLEHGTNIYRGDNMILKDLREKFDEQLADIILPYCAPDDYEYFPPDYICANVIATKSANNILQIQ